MFQPKPQKGCHFSATSVTDGFPNHPHLRWRFLCDVFGILQITRNLVEGWTFLCCKVKAINMKQLYTEGAGNSLYSKDVKKNNPGPTLSYFPHTKFDPPWRIAHVLQDFRPPAWRPSPCNAEYQEVPTPCPTASSSCLAGWLRSNHRNHLGNRNPTATVESFCGFNEDGLTSILVSGEQPQQTQLVQFVTQKTLAPDLSKFVVKGGVSFLVLSHHPLEYEGTEILHRPVKLTAADLDLQDSLRTLPGYLGSDSHEHFYCSDRNRAPGIHCHCPPSDLHTYT